LELLDVYDKAGKRTGKIVDRSRISQDLKEGEFFQAVHVWIKNSDGQYLIQKRSMAVKKHPGMWATTSGAVSTGEDSITSAQRELSEELGIHETNMPMLFICRSFKNKEILDVFLVEGDYLIEELELQVSEVSQAKWSDKEEILQMVKDEEFRAYGTEYFDHVLNIDWHIGVKDENKTL